MREAPALGRLVPFAPRDSVHVWHARVSVLERWLAELRDVLSDQERARVEQFRFSRDRHRAIVARGLLRVILGRCLDAEPSRLCFTYGPHGKPALSEDRGVCFNVAHSGDLVLWAVAREHDIGVDVERMRAGLEWPAMAARFFAPGEVAALHALPGERRQEGFFACWTRKESYLKATGLGLALRLEAFSVSVDPRAPAALLSVEGVPDASARWSLADLTVDPGYRACLAAPEPRVRPVRHEIAGGAL